MKCLITLLKRREDLVLNNDADENDLLVVKTNAIQVNKLHLKGAQDLFLWDEETTIKSLRSNKPSRDIRNLLLQFLKSHRIRKIKPLTPKKRASPMKRDSHHLLESVDWQKFTLVRDSGFQIIFKIEDFRNVPYDDDVLLLRE